MTSPTTRDSGHRVVLHVGYPKTATTTLQRQAFLPWHQAGLIDYLGVFQTRIHPWDFAGLSDRLRELVYLPDGERALSSAEQCNQSLRAMAERHTAGRPIVISSEHFTMGGYSTQWGDVAICPTRSAHRLRRALDGFDVQIVVVLRDHAELAESYFLQHKATPAHANADRYTSLEGFVAEVQSDNGCHSHMFRFADVLEAYAHAFGSGSIHVFGFPSVSRDIESFVAAVWQLTGALVDRPPSGLTRINARTRTADGYRSASVGLGSYLASVARRSSRLTSALRYFPGARRIRSLLEHVRISGGAEVNALSQAQIDSLRHGFSEDRRSLQERWGIRL